MAGEGVLAAWTSLGRRRLWSAVTLVGILLGVGGLLTIDALNQAQSAANAAQLAQLGVNLVVISPAAPTSRSGAGATLAARLTVADLQALQFEVPNVVALTAQVSGTEWVAFGDRRRQIPVVGAEPIDARLESLRVRTGRFIVDWDGVTGARVVVVGQTVADTLFAGADPIGRSLRIRNVEFAVIGVLASRGHSASADLDDVAIIPYRTAEERLFGNVGVGSVLLQASDPERVGDVGSRARTILERSHRIPAGQADDFRIANNQPLVDAARAQAAFLPRVLTGLAIVALTLGGIGVTNVMLLAVAERTPEIGIRLAVGAQPRDIQAQFLIEALILTLTGSVLGSGLGIAAALAIPQLIVAVAADPTFPSPTAFITGLLAPLAIGLAFGFYPARKAAQLDPIVALRARL
jgi:putative ABC transport system permease protein